VQTYELSPEATAAELFRLRTQRLQLRFALQRLRLEHFVAGGEMPSNQAAGLIDQILYSTKD
jgi:hypothetical protein